MPESEIALRPPDVADGSRITQLISRSGPLDLNSEYLYLLLCHHFSDTCVLAEQGNALAGFLSAYRPPRQPDTVFVWQIAVDAPFRGRGLAWSMIEHLLQRNVCRDVRFLEATVSPSNQASRGLFQSVARRLGTECHVGPLFTEEMFLGTEAHESEDLFRIGPFSFVRSESETS